MLAPLSRIATLMIVAGTGAACGNGGPGPQESELSGVEVTPAAATLFTVAPGKTVTLSVVGRDHEGRPMAGDGPPSFSSDNGAIATVGDNGTVTGVAEGTALISVSLTAGGVAKTGTATMTVQAAAANAVVLAPAVAFLAPTVDVQAGGTVTWTFGGVTHNVTFTSAGSPANVAALQNGSDSRTFPTGGAYAYRCTLHESMYGAVHVH